MPAELLRPPALRTGDRVAVLAASSPIPPERLAAGVAVLRAAGLDAVVYPSARATGTLRRYLAGDDALRAADLGAALADPSVAGIFFARGGSGAQRTLAALDWTPIDATRPKVLAGFSDVTAILEAVAVRLGWASVHATTMVVPDDAATETSVESLLRMTMAPELVTTLAYPEAETVVGGQAAGVTVGGNLCLLAASLGTPTSRPASGGILLVEDVTEEDFRLDRMLTQLLRAGYLDGVAGIITGSFVDCGPRERVHEILVERLGSLAVPMISWAGIGHGGFNRAFPIGVPAVLDADACTLRLPQPPLVPAGAP